MNTEHDWNLSPESAKDWQIGDTVWVDHTLYVVDGFEGTKANLRRHEPITIRRLPEKSGESR